MSIIKSTGPLTEGLQSAIRKNLLYIFRTVQCDLHLDLDCTNYLLYDFPDEIDIEIYEALRADGNIEQTYDQERLRKAFCIYLDG